ncbi:phage holin family protein [Actinophytocola sediminis]
MAKPATAKSTAELVNDLTDQVGHLVRTELRLAVRETQDKAKHAGAGVAGLGTAGLLALFGVGALVATLVLVLDLVMPVWVAALIVAVVLFLAAAVAAMVGRRQLRRSSPMPSAAVRGAKRDMHVVKEAAKR